MVDSQKERRRYDEIANVYEWETMYPVKDFFYTILAMLLGAFIFIAPVVLFAYWFV